MLCSDLSLRERRAFYLGIRAFHKVFGHRRTPTAVWAVAFRRRLDRCRGTTRFRRKPRRSRLRNPLEPPAPGGTFRRGPPAASRGATTRAVPGAAEAAAAVVRSRPPRAPPA